jgi:hypothetical protein
MIARMENARIKACMALPLPSRRPMIRFERQGYIVPPPSYQHPAAPPRFAAGETVVHGRRFPSLAPIVTPHRTRRSRPRDSPLSRTEM